MKFFVVLSFLLLSLSIYAGECTEAQATDLALIKLNSRVNGYTDLKKAVYVDGDRPDENGWGYYNVIFTYHSSANDPFFPDRDMVVNFLIAGSLCKIEAQTYMSLYPVIN